MYNSGSSVYVVKTVIEEVVYIRAQHEIAWRKTDWVGKDNKACLRNIKVNNIFQRVVFLDKTLIYDTKSMHKDLSVCVCGAQQVAR